MLFDSRSQNEKPCELTVGSFSFGSEHRLSAVNTGGKLPLPKHTHLRRGRSKEFELIARVEKCIVSESQVHFHPKFMEEQKMPYVKVGEAKRKEIEELARH